MRNKNPLSKVYGFGKPSRRSEKPSKPLIGKAATPVGPKHPRPKPDHPPEQPKPPRPEPPPTPPPPPPPPPITPVAAFSGSPLSGELPLQVNFVNESTGNPTEFFWQFGDGGTSVLENPGHIYNVAGTYNVSLTAINSAGNNTLVKTNYVTITAPVPVPVPDYPKGMYTSIGTTATVPAAIAANKGIVGLGVGLNWNIIEPVPGGGYDFSQMDLRIQNAKNAGFQSIVLQITWSPFDSPLIGNTIPILDVGEDHNTFCQLLTVPLYFDPDYHAARLALIAAAGARYTNDPAIKATFATFMSRSSMDWGTFTQVGASPCPPPNNAPLDQPQQLLDAGWTRALMLQIGKEIVDAVAVAFPNQCLKLPIGAIKDNRLNQTSPDPLGGLANQTTLAREITDYVYGNTSLGIPARPYANRFYISRNTFAVPSPTAPELIANPPPVTSENYIFKMILDKSPNSGLQTVDAASRCRDGQVCRQNGSQPCINALQVMTNSLDEMRTYGTTWLECFTQDGQNVTVYPAYNGRTTFYQLMRDTTIAMGGTPRP